MTNEEMDRLIEFITDAQAKTRSYMIFSIQRINELGESRSQTREQIDADRGESETSRYRQEVRRRMDADQQKTRDAINRLNISNEVTRNLAREVEKELALAIGHKVTALQNK